MRKEDIREKKFKYKHSLENSYWKCNISFEWQLFFSIPFNKKKKKKIKNEELCKKKTEIMDDILRYWMSWNTSGTSKGKVTETKGIYEKKKNT